MLQMSNNMIPANIGKKNQEEIGETQDRGLKSENIE